MIVKLHEKQEKSLIFCEECVKFQIFSEKSAVRVQKFLQPADRKIRDKTAAAELWKPEPRIMETDRGNRAGTWLNEAAAKTVTQRKPVLQP